MATKNERAVAPARVRARSRTRTLALGGALIVAAMAAVLPARADFANPDGVAVIIGNRTYAGDIPDRQ